MLTFPDPSIEQEYTDQNGSTWDWNSTGWVRRHVCSGDNSGSGDPYWSRVELQMQFDDIASPWKDDTAKHAPNPLQAAESSDVEFRNGGRSLLVNPTGSTNDGVEVDGLPGDCLTGLWTAEAWIYPLNSAGTSGTTRRSILSGCTASNGNNSSFKLFQSGNNLQLTVNTLDASNNSTQIVNTVTAGREIQLNVWQHVAVSHDGNFFRVFIDGVLLAAEKTVWGQSGCVYLEIGRAKGTNALKFSGYMDDVRITDGVARYTDDFTTPGSLPTWGTRILTGEDQ